VDLAWRRNISIHMYRFPSEAGICAEGLTYLREERNGSTEPDLDDDYDDGNDDDNDNDNDT
jgi:hypothetical protein